jgi:hypothetical protein
MESSGDNSEINLLRYIQERNLIPDRNIQQNRVLLKSRRQLIILKGETTKLWVVEL